MMDPRDSAGSCRASKFVGEGRSLARAPFQFPGSHGVQQQGAHFCNCRDGNEESKNKDFKVNQVAFECMI